MSASLAETNEPVEKQKKRRVKLPCWLYCGERTVFNEEGERHDEACGEECTGPQPLRKTVFFHRGVHPLPWPELGDDWPAGAVACDFQASGDALVQRFWSDHEGWSAPVRNVPVTDRVEDAHHVEDAHRVADVLVVTHRYYFSNGGKLIQHRFYRVDVDGGRWLLVSELARDAAAAQPQASVIQQHVLWLVADQWVLREGHLAFRVEHRYGRVVNGVVAPVEQPPVLVDVIDYD